MPTFRPAKTPKPIEIDEFYGLNQSVGETEIKLGESVVQTNFRLTTDYKPQKREGHSKFIDFGNALDVQGIWYGEIATKEIMLAINNGNVYEYDMTVDTDTTAIADLITEGTVTNIGTISDAKTTIFWFGGSLYFINGTDFKTYDGTTYGEVTAYEPTLAIETPPAGGGTDYEQVNLLTGAKKQNFTGDGSSTIYQIRELNIDADLVQITVDGVAKTEGVDFTVNRVLGQITFSVAPVLDALVIIRWVKASASNVALVKNNRFAMDFGPGNDTNVFLWGNTNVGNRRMRSGTLDATYWPEFSFTLIGTNQFPITDIVAQYDRQIIFKTNRTFYSYAEYISVTDTYEYPVFDLNERVGNVSNDGVRLVDNTPVALYGQSMWRWTNTQIEDERNANVISERIRYSIEDLDLSTAVTFDYQKEKEYWMNVGTDVYIWNYGNDTFYKYDNVEATEFCDVNNVVYYGSVGTVEKFGGFTDNGTAVHAIMELGFTDFGVNELSKTTRYIWASIQPYSRTSVDISYATNRFNTGETKAIKPVSFALLDFGNIDFSQFTFLTNRNPQIFRRKIRAKKYAYIKFIFENEELDEYLVILSLKIIAETQGFNK